MSRLEPLFSDGDAAGVLAVLQKETHTDPTDDFDWFSHGERLSRFIARAVITQPSSSGCCADAEPVIPLNDTVRAILARLLSGWGMPAGTFFSAGCALLQAVERLGLAADVVPWHLCTFGSLAHVTVVVDSSDTYRCGFSYALVEWAVTSASFETLQSLLALGCDPNEQRGGVPPLALVAVYDRRAIRKLFLLLDAGASPRNLCYHSICQGPLESEDSCRLSIFLAYMLDTDGSGAFTYEDGHALCDIVTNVAGAILGAPVPLGEEASELVFLTHEMETHCTSIAEAKSMCPLEAAATDLAVCGDEVIVN